MAALVMFGIFSVQRQKTESDLAAVSSINHTSGFSIGDRIFSFFKGSDDTGSLDGNPMSASEYAEFQAFMAANPEAMLTKKNAVSDNSNTGDRISGRSEYVVHSAAPCPCVCPYGKVMIILGVKSKPGDKDYEWFKKNFPTAELIPLGKTAGDAKIAEIRKIATDYVNDPKCPKQKLLLVGYSLGGAIVKSLKADCGDCADIIAIDPPYPTKVCTRTLVWLSKPFSAQLREICRGASATIDDSDLQINWTDGNSLNPRHYPWRNLDALGAQRLTDLKSAIDKKMQSCKDSAE